MGRVFVAGSINMDVVATAERHPRIGETVAGKEVLYFPGGKGANQAVAAAKQGVLTTLIGRLGADNFGKELRTFLAAQSIDLGSVKDTADAHTGTAIITVANSDNSKSGVGASWDYSTKLGTDNLLTANEISFPRTLKFNNPNNEAFTVTFNVIGNVDRAAAGGSSSSSSSGGGGSGGTASSGTGPTSMLYSLVYNPLLNSITSQLIKP